MYITSHHGNYGTNFYSNIVKGKIIVSKDESNTIHYHVDRGSVSGYTEYLGTGRRKLREVVYGVSLKAWNAKGKKTQDEIIRPGTTLSIKPQLRRIKYSATLNGYPGTLTLKKYGGSLRGECFKYKGGKVAYDTRRGTKAAKVGLTILSPDKKVFAQFTGPIDFSWRHYTGVDGSLFLKKGTPKEDYLDLNTLKVMDGPNYQVLIKDREFNILTEGKIENNQKSGKWTEEGKTIFYIQGVGVSEKLFYAKPEDLDPAEVLGLENAQLRASFIGKIGLERIIQKLQGEVIDTDEGRGYSLIVLPMKAVKVNSWDRDPDTKMVVLKVRCPSTGAFYCLRVPPQMTKVEQARQWTFGVDTTERAEDATQYFELEKET